MISSMIIDQHYMWCLTCRSYGARCLTLPAAMLPTNMPALQAWEAGLANNIMTLKFTTAQKTILRHRLKTVDCRLWTPDS